MHHNEGSVSAITYNQKFVRNHVRYNKGPLYMSFRLEILFYSLEYITISWGSIILISQFAWNWYFDMGVVKL